MFTGRTKTITTAGGAAIGSTPAGAAPAPCCDRSLLARFAPILVLERHELFRPTSFDGYVAACRLVTGRDDAIAVAADDLDDRWGAGTSLRFVTDADRRAVSNRLDRRLSQRTSSARLGCVGLFGRLLGAVFQLSVWLRPTLPRRTATAAAMRARQLELEQDPVCYGRVVTAGEWLVLHYAWFYVMNDWRTGYGGLNDHEGDWEQAWIFCDPADGRPIWVASTCHEHRGPDLRRHWDDPEVTTEGDQVILYAAGGSHALFFQPGDYVTRIDVPGLRWTQRARRWMAQHWSTRGPELDRGPGPALGIPFVDVARGDGDAITQWDVRSMDGAPWAEEYRGLWGADTGDPLQAERGPGGPKFDRRGEIRRSWADPLGFVGLHGTPPPSAIASRVSLAKLERVIQDLDGSIRASARVLPLAAQTGRSAHVVAESERLTDQLRLRSELEDVRLRIQRGRWRATGIRDHLRDPAVPLRSDNGPSWLARTWAALSVPLVLAVIASAILDERIALGPALVGVTLALLPIGGSPRRRAALAAVTAVAVAVVVAGSGPLATAGRLTVAVVALLLSAIFLAVNGRELFARTGWTPDDQLDVEPC